MVVSTRPNHTNLLLLGAAPFLELPGVAVIVAAFPEVAAASVLGSAWTLAVLVAAFGVSMWGVALAWSPSAPTAGTRRAFGASVCVLCAVLAVPTAGFLISGRWLVPGILLAHSGLNLILIARQAIRGVAATPAPAGRG